MMAPNNVEEGKRTYAVETVRQKHARHAYRYAVTHGTFLYTSMFEKREVYDPGLM